MGLRCCHGTISQSLNRPAAERNRSSFSSHYQTYMLYFPACTILIIYSFIAESWTSDCNAAEKEPRKSMDEIHAATVTQFNRKSVQTQ